MEVTGKDGTRNVKGIHPKIVKAVSNFTQRHTRLPSITVSIDHISLIYHITGQHGALVFTSWKRSESQQQYGLP